MITQREPNEQIGQRVLVGTVSNYVGQFAAYGAWFFLTPFILGKLGPVVYGLWVLAGSVVAYGSLLDFGMWGAIIKYVAEYRARGEQEAARELIATALTLFTLVGLLPVLLAFLLAPLFPVVFNVPPGQEETARWVVLLMGAGIGVFIPCMISLSVLRGLQRYDLVNIVNLVGTIWEVAATITVLTLGGGVIGLVLVNIAGMLVMQLPAIYFINKFAPDLQFGYRGARRRYVRQVVVYSWPLFVVDMANRLQTKTDEITIGALLIVSAVTPYAIVRKLSEATFTLTQQFLRVLLPLASQLDAEQDEPRMRTLYLVGSRLAMAIFLPLAGVLVYLAAPLLAAWVGPAYAENAPVMVLLTGAGYAVVSQGTGVAILKGKNRHRLLAATSISAGLVNLLLSVLLARPFGLLGVAFGTLLPALVENFLLILPYVARILHIDARTIVRQVYLPVLIPLLPMMALLYLLQLAVPPEGWVAMGLTAIVGVGSYSLAYLFVGASVQERSMIRRATWQAIQIVGGQLRRFLQPTG